MLRHILLAVFLIALAMPAMALTAPAADATAVAAEDCHGMPSPESGGKRPNGEVRLHGCIGCIAPLATVLPVEWRESPRFTPCTEPVRRLTGTTPRPNLPPPRG